MAVFAALLGLAACYNANPIEQLALSPDGRWVALRMANGELGLLDLEAGGPLRVFSTVACRGMAWSEDSGSLAFVEQFPNRPMSLCLLDPFEGRAPAPLLADTTWKADPVWLSPKTLAFLSDREADDVNVWTISLGNGQLIKMLDREADITRLWGRPGGRDLVFETAEEGTPQLWIWSAREDKYQLLTQNRAESEAAENWVAFSADGLAMAYVDDTREERNLVLFDLASRAVTRRLRLEAPVRAISVAPGPRVLASLGGSLLAWNPGARWWQREIDSSRWGHIGLDEICAWGAHGVVLTANGNVVLAARDVDDLDDGDIHARRTEDLVALAHAHLREGRPELARRMLKELWDNSRNNRRERFLLAAAWARLERARGDFARADEWLGQALAASEAGSPEHEAARNERLVMAFAEGDDPGLAAELIRQAPSAAAGPDASDPATDASDGMALDALVGNLLLQPEATREAWRAIAAALRLGDYPPAARGIFEQCAGSDATTASLRALRGVLDGRWQPFGVVDGSDQRDLHGLMREGPFQRALWQVSRGANPAAPPGGELRGMLLAQWAGEGDLSSARALVREDLKNARESVIDYIDTLENYLVNEEAEPWVQRTVNKVLMEPSILEGLRAQFDDPADRFTIQLARVKHALAEGDFDGARALNVEARRIVPQPSGADGAVAREAFLLDLFDAKINERFSKWPEALEAYRGCLRRMEQDPANFDAGVYEIVKAIALIEDGRHSPDLLESHLRVLRGMGDPLLSPSKSAGTLLTAVNNLQTLSRYSGEPWLSPYLLATEGFCYSMLDRDSQALARLQRALASGPTDGLKQRILLELAALRDAQGQHALAARLYGQICAMPLPDPLRASALQAMIQSEWAAGMIDNRASRLADLTATHAIPPQWTHWLELQLGLVDDF